MKKQIVFLCMVCLIGMGAESPRTAQKQSPKADKSTTKPDLQSMEKLVWKHFESDEQFHRSDLISREEVEPLIKKLEAAGFVLKKPEELTKLLLPKSDFLYTELKTPAGQKFSKKIASYPDGYDRLDRLRHLPQGKQTVRDLIRGPGGEKMIEYMTTASGGKELGKMLSKDPQGTDFNTPTGRIYTVSDLVKYLKKQFEPQPKTEKKTVR